MAKDKRSIRQFIFSWGGVLLFLVLLVMANLLASRLNFRLDATEDRLYSLSSGTLAILEDLNQDVTIKLFFSKDIPTVSPQLKTYAARLRDFLAEYETAGSGRIEVEEYNPRIDSDEEEWARMYGIEGIDIPTGERLYFGLVALAKDQEEAIPFLDPTREQQLEYDMTRIISRVRSPEKQKIGIVSGLPVFGQQQPPMGMQGPMAGMEPWLFVQELEKTYAVSQIPPNAEAFDSDLDLLMLVNPGQLSPGLLYAIDQYVLAGGNLLVFADPMSTQNPAPGASQSPMKTLFAAWGIEVEAGKILLDMNYPTRLRTRENRIETNPAWISLSAEAMNGEDVITAKLESMLLPAAGAVAKLEGSQYEYEPLLQSSGNASLTDAFMAQLGVEEMRRDFQPAGKPFDLAAKVRGKFKTAFPQGPPQEEGKAPKAASGVSARLAEATHPSTVVVVADSDLLFDGYYVNRQNFLGVDISSVFNDNLNFLLNTVEVLAGSSALIDIRSRGTFARPFTRVQELEAQAEARWLAREQELVRRAEETNRKLQELESRKEASQQFVMSREQEAEIRRFQEERRKINQELKEVRKNLRADIERLGNTLKAVNIFLMPLLVALGGTLFAIYRHRKSRVG